MIPGFGSGFGLAAAGDNGDSPAPMLAISHKATADKRPRAEDDDGEEGEDSERITGGSGKRHKESEMQVNCGHRICVYILTTRQDVEASPTFSPHLPTQHGHYYRDRETHAAMMLYDNGLGSGSLGEHQVHPHSDDPPPTYNHNHNHPSSRASTVAREFSEIPESVAVQNIEMSVLEDTLGIDVNAFVSGKLDHYEANKKKWAECAPERWSVGRQGRFAFRYRGDPFC